MPEQIKIRMSTQEFMERFDEQPFEIIGEEIIEMTPAKKQHSKISKRIYDRILYYLVEHDVGEVFFETTYILEDKSDWVEGSRVPKVSFYERKRYDKYEADNPQSDDKPFILVPDLAVEVISPNDKYSDVSMKINAYINDGVQLLWIVDPQNNTIAVYEAGSDTPKTLHKGDSLSGVNVLPDYAIGVTEVFG